PRPLPAGDPRGVSGGTALVRVPPRGDLLWGLHVRRRTNDPRRATEAADADLGAIDADRGEDARRPRVRSATHARVPAALESRPHPLAEPTMTHVAAVDVLHGPRSNGACACRSSRGSITRSFRSPMQRPPFAS